LQDAVCADIEPIGTDTMTLAHIFVGCDISKDFIDIYDDETRKISKIANNPQDLAIFVANYSDKSVQFIMEATGIYDNSLRHALDEARIAYSRVNPMRAHKFGQAQGKQAKTDPLDAKMLAQMGRKLELPADLPINEAAENLNALSLRRDQLVEARKIERQQLHSTRTGSAAYHDIETLIVELTTRIEVFEVKIAEFIDNIPEMQAKKELLLSCPGIGKVTCAVLLSQLTELGELSMQKIAALVGLCPYDYQSGKMQGKKSIRGGRSRVRAALYMSAISCIRNNNRFKKQYLALKERGKAPKVAIVAIARKIITTLNTMLKRKELYADKPIKNLNLLKA
jgi:transposase